MGDLPRLGNLCAVAHGLPITSSKGGYDPPCPAKSSTQRNPWTNEEHKQALNRKRKRQQPPKAPPKPPPTHPHAPA